MANTKITNPELFNLGDSTSATQLPVMTTTERIAMDAPPTLNIDYLVVAGGGGGGLGGGGAGGYRTSFGTGNINGGNTPVENTLTLATGSPGYTVTIGDGGAGIVGNGTLNQSDSGNNSVFSSITSTGGGGAGTGGSSGSFNAGVNGGSGGGSHNNYTAGAAVTNPTQGFSGGIGTNATGGGGGGAGGAGNNNTTGGVGLDSLITDTSIPYAGGGGGYPSGAASYGGGAAGGAGTGSSAAANTGAGGGGGVNGGAGGSGVVILRYPTADVASYTATGLTPTETTVGTNTVLSFTTVGTGTITFASSTPTNAISTGEMIFNSDTDKVEYWDGTKWYGITYEVVLNPCYNYTDPVTPYINFNLTDPLGTNASNNVLNISPATYTGQITQTVAPTTDATLGYKYFDEPTWDNGLQLSATPSLGSYGTIIAWVKFDSVTSGTQRHSIFGEGDSGNTSKWMVFRYNNGTGKIQWSCNGSTANRTCDVNKTLSNNVWYQIAFVKNNNSTAQFYLNGVSAGTTLYSVGSTTEWFNNISGNKWSWGSFQRGTYGVYDPMYAKSGSLKVFVDTALSASQILADYNYTKTCYGIS